MIRVRPAKWRRERPPPIPSFQKTQVTLRLFTPIFALDSFLQNPLSKDGRFCRRLSIFYTCLRSDTVILAVSRKNSRKIFHSVEKRPRCRGPPLLKSRLIPDFRRTGGLPCVAVLHRKAQLCKLLNFDTAFFAKRRIFMLRQKTFFNTKCRFRFTCYTPKHGSDGGR